MSAKSRILVDANVALDVLAKRKPHYATSAAVWALAEQGKVEGLLAAHTVTTLHYLVAKHLDRQQANVTITKLLQVFDVAAVDQEVLLKALTLNWQDFDLCNKK
jgi:predicted nucleic acid-binding protein